MLAFLQEHDEPNEYQGRAPDAWTVWWIASQIYGDNPSDNWWHAHRDEARNTSAAAQRSAVRRALALLQRQGLVERTGPDHRCYWRRATTKAERRTALRHWRKQRKQETSRWHVAQIDTNIAEWEQLLNA